MMSLHVQLEYSICLQALRMFPFAQLTTSVKVLPADNPLRFLPCSTNQDDLKTLFQTQCKQYMFWFIFDIVAQSSYSVNGYFMTVHPLLGITPLLHLPPFLPYKDKVNNSLPHLCTAQTFC
ncbi:hypothetical protein ILYODFUR_013461 [Ilyodon furcidens]|uniref:Uncharacterized protein n=1 Tax=Ilyodon furcidens TaxID=33524 RepID=A0ABV0V6B2_9TELE